LDVGGDWLARAWQRAPASPPTEARVSAGMSAYLLASLVYALAPPPADAEPPPPPVEGEDAPAPVAGEDAPAPAEGEAAPAPDPVPGPAPLPGPVPDPAEGLPRDERGDPVLEYADETPDAPELEYADETPPPPELEYADETPP